MEEHLSPLAVTHLLQHTLRSLCIHPNSQWDGQGGYDRSRGNRRNWILVWEDGFCNFGGSSSGDYGKCELQPELFFKMSHEIYNYGEGLIGKVAADQSHKWIYKEPNDQEINFLSAWHNSADSHPRTWEAQFQSGIKVIEDLSYVVVLRKKLSYIESIPGVLLPHPSSAAASASSSSCANNYNYKMDGGYMGEACPWQYLAGPGAGELYDLKITPSMSSLEALLSKLPSVVPPDQHNFVASTQPQRPPNFHFKQETIDQDQDEEELYRPHHLHADDTTTSVPPTPYFHHHTNLTSPPNNNAF
ncbi:protein RICE SALT SENSITIVE 3 [Senna tora]|uniref:Protein RICE SALT SENSITIVE 3 n=1 Tax=Senna tora TaxID=362788 RepID=A0A834WQ71_9FABA|nr:protein RICE SALT SENSITIVE 3 [Senna tora]